MTPDKISQLVEYFVGLGGGLTAYYFARKHLAKGNKRLGYFLVVVSALIFIASLKSCMRLLNG